MVCEHERTKLDVTIFMGRVREGDAQAFDKLHQRYRQRVASFFRQHLVDIAATDDLTQEVFKRIWDKREKYKSGTPDIAYLLGYSRFVLLEYRAELQSRLSSESKYAQDSILEATLDSPFAAAEVKEQHQKLRALMATLPDRQRQALEQRYLAEQSSRAASEQLACTDGTVRDHCRLAIRKLRKCLREDSPRTVPLSRKGEESSGAGLAVWCDKPPHKEIQHNDLEAI